MKAILFVDDEPFILEGMKGLLRKQRGSWDMGFVASGPAALEVLSQKSYDVVVSDMRMPGMDGAELLGRIRKLHPRTARVILSGQASHQDLIRARPVAQQILSKPCERSVLCETIERLFKVQALLDNERIQTLVGRLQGLPLFPKCFHELTQAMTRLELSMPEIVRVVEQDPALSVMVLSIANAGYFGRPQGTLSVQKAIDVVGLQLLQAMALSTDMFTRIDASLLKSKVMLDLPRQSLLKARLARKFVDDPSFGDEAFAAALLLDIGQLVLAQDAASGYLALLETSVTDPRPLYELERERLGFTHAEVSGYLLGLWGLPARVVELVAKHPHPEFLEPSQPTAATAVHIADVLVDAFRTESADPFAAIAPSVRERPEIQVQLAPWWAMVKEAAQGM